jgi:CheY-like chemotaxis protein
MDQSAFTDLFKDLMNDLFDFAALETHPLARALEMPPEYHGSRAQFVQQMVLQAIENLRPPGSEPSINLPEWRPYLILKRRFVDGITPQALAAEFHVGDRQLRRDQSRALDALASSLWDQYYRAVLEGSQNGTEAGAAGFAVHPEPLGLIQVTRGVIDTLRPYAAAEKVELETSFPDEPVPVLTDRIILRQILFSLCSYAFNLQADHRVGIAASRQAGRGVVTVSVTVAASWSGKEAEEHEGLLKSARSWVQQIGAALVEYFPPRGEAGQVRLELSLPGKDQPVILVVDDQEPTLRMYQRYLGRTHYKVVGVADPTQVLALAARLQPALILLDVMMPRVDGWEILQTLRQDVQTCRIPVIVCSAWEAGEMAKSLGAAAFLKKPIMQKGLLEALERLDLPALG